MKFFEKQKEGACCEPGCCGAVETQAQTESLKESQTESETEIESERLKAQVREKYASIAVQAETSCCGGGGGCGMAEVTTFSEEYSGMDGYVADADLHLGCGVPTDLARLRAGDAVVDLGSGAGNDAFVARALVGEAGRVIGVDMTPQMVAKARANNRKMGYANVEFRLGEIEHVPVESGSADVVLSNCVLNLVPDKDRAFAEMFRILKPGGHFSVSDIVLSAPLPDFARKAAELYTGCVSGAQEKSGYLETARRAGFQGIRVDREREINLPDSLLEENLTPDQRAEFRASGVKILSINLFGERPAFPETRK